MGNTCCLGRNNLSSQKQSEVPKNPPHIKVKPPTSRKSSIKTEKPSASNIAKKSTWQEIADFNAGSTSTSKLINEEASLAYSSSESNSLANKEPFNGANVFSNRTELHEGLDYDLILPEKCSKVQQNQIISVLDRNKHFISEDEDEIVDGLADIIENGQKKAIMITTHAVYTLDCGDYSIVHRRVKLEDIALIAVSEIISQLLLESKSDTIESLLVKSDSFKDLAKAVQQVHYEAFDCYIPWLSHEGDLSIKSVVKSLPKKRYNKEDLALLKVFVENGEVGEEKVICEQCSDSLDAEERNVFFVLTPLAVYMLGQDYELIKQILFENIEKVVINKKNAGLIFYEVGGVTVFGEVAEHIEKIKQEAIKNGKKLKVEEE